MRFSSSIVLLAVSAQCIADTFEIDLWPGEGRPVLKADSPELPLRRDPSSSSVVVQRVAVAPEARVDFDATRFRTIRAGSITALTNARIKGRSLGQVTILSRDEYYREQFPPADFSVAAGEVIEYLQYRAEGTCFVRSRGQTIDADPCPAVEPTKFRLDGEPEVEWWVHAIIGGAAGWVRIGDGGLRVVDREF